VPPFPLASITSSPGRRLYLAHTRLRQRVSDQFRLSGHPITTEEWALLCHLVELGTLTQAELAARTEKDGPLTSRLVDSLEEHGYVQRCVSPDDRRSRIVELTKDGRAAQASLSKIAADVLGMAFDGVSERDFKAFIHVLDHLIERLPPRNTCATQPCQTGKGVGSHGKT
jgi:DNA-binding MarR family transcriptional regulator